MSVPDPSRAYNAGVIQVNLNRAAEALADAFSAALTTEGYDNPLTQHILHAQSYVGSAQKLPVDWVLTAEVHS